MQHAPTPSLPSPGGKDKATEFHVIVCMMMTSVNEMIYGLRPEKLGSASEVLLPDRLFSSLNSIINFKFQWLYIAKILIKLFLDRLYRNSL